MKKFSIVSYLSHILSNVGNPLFYFAYGANMNMNEMKSRCPRAILIGPGFLENYKLEFTEDAAGLDGGVATVVKEKDSQVWGLVFQITKKDLDIMDKFEGYPAAYTRFQTVIDCQHRFITEVWVYSVVNHRGFVPPARFYLNWIKEAAQKYSFPSSYQLYLETVPTK